MLPLSTDFPCLLIFSSGHLVICHFPIFGLCLYTLTHPHTLISPLYPTQDQPCQGQPTQGPFQPCTAISVTWRFLRPFFALPASHHPRFRVGSIPSTPCPHGLHVLVADAICELPAPCPHSAPQHWVPLPMLYDAMSYIDPETGRSRGYMRLASNPLMDSVLLTLDLRTDGWRPADCFIRLEAPALVQVRTGGRWVL